MCIRYKLCGHVSWNKSGLAMVGPAGAAPMTYDLLKQRAVGYWVDNFIMLLSISCPAYCDSFYKPKARTLEHRHIRQQEINGVARHYTVLC